MVDWGLVGMGGEGLRRDEAVWMGVGMGRCVVELLWLRAQSGGGFEKSRSFDRDFLAIGGSRDENSCSGTVVPQVPFGEG